MTIAGPLLAPEIVGRARELAVLRAGLAGARSGHGSTGTQLATYARHRSRTAEGTNTAST